MSNDNSETSNKKKGIIVFLLLAAVAVVISSMWPSSPAALPEAAQVSEPALPDVSDLPSDLTTYLKPVTVITSNTKEAETMGLSAVTVKPVLVQPQLLTHMGEEATILLSSMQLVTNVQLLAQLEDLKASVRAAKNKDPLDSLGIGVDYAGKATPVTTVGTSIEPSVKPYMAPSAVQLRSLITTNGRTTAWLGINGEIVKVVPRMNIGSITVKQVSPKGVQIVEGGQSRWLSPHLPSIQLSTVEVTNGKQ